MIDHDFSSKALGSTRAQATTAPEQLCRILGGWFKTTGQAGLPNPPSWSEVLALAEETKTIGLIGKGAAALDLLLPEEISAKIDRWKQAALRTNAANVAWTYRVAGIFERAGIRSVVLKGPIRTQDLFGSLDARKSNDIDFFVDRSDYLAARRALIASGFQALVPEDDDWWHIYLGESPFWHPDQSSPVVDLHHELQQRGGPRLAEQAAFIDETIAVSNNGRTLLMPSPAQSLLLLAINIGKAIMAVEPWLHHVHEFRLAQENLTAAARSDFEKLVRRSELTRLVKFCEDSVDRVFCDSAGEQNAAILDIAIGKTPRKILRRSRNLWRWTDGFGMKRVRNFLASERLIFRSYIAFCKSPSRIGIN